MDRLIFHIDVNSAFLSWEAARRVAQGEPDIRLIPSAIGGDRDKRTGVIVAKSIPAKKLGVRTGEPVSMALRKCPELFLAKPDFRLYSKNSRAFMDICARYAPALEKFSIDECFLDMSGTGSMYPDPVGTARRIADEIRDTLGFTVNVGVSENKLLAKMASDFEKPDRVHTLFRSELPQKMWPLPVGELFTVGRSTAQKLEKASIMTIGELAGSDVRVIQGLVGAKLGRQIHDYANGIDNSPVRAEREAAKGYSISTTLEDDVTDADAAKNILLALADSVAARMRGDGKRAGCVAVTIRANDFRDRSHQMSLHSPTDVTREIYELSVKLFSELWDGRTPLRLLGIALSGVTDAEYSQASLFDDGRYERARRLDRAMDAIRGKFGADSVRPASTMNSTGRIGRKYKAELEDDR